MNSNTELLGAQAGQAVFDLVRISRAKRIVDVTDNTLRSYHRLGLPFYRCGRAVFFSKTELSAFIRSGAGSKGSGEVR